MRLVFDPVREHFLKRTAAAEPYVEALVPAGVRGFEYAADKRLAMQRITYSALTYRTRDVRRWITHGDTSPSAGDWATAVSIAVIVISLNLALRSNPYTGVPLTLMDIRNLYNYYY